MSSDKMKEVCEALQMEVEGGNKQDCSVDDLVKIIEDLTRIH